MSLDSFVAKQYTDILISKILESLNKEKKPNNMVALRSGHLF